MRVMAAVLFTTAVFLGSVAFGEDVDEHRGSEAPVPPYNRHQDPHHGHNHVYPDRGAIFHELPRRAVTVNYAGVSYRFADGIWFEPRGPAFIVVAPPIGLMVPSLPELATTIQEHGETYLYANDVYYRPRPDLGGYEVVNDPAEAAATTQDTAPSAAPASASAAAAPALAVATALPTVAATSVSAALPTAGVAPAAVAAAVPSGAPAAAPAAGAESVLREAPPPPSSAATSLSAAAPAAAPAAAAPAAVASASTAAASTAAAPQSTKVIAYPRNAQSAEQQARDHYECYQFGVAQSGFDPMRSGAIGVEQQSTFDRAQNACFEGRGYTVR
jgi:hypothetical protein